MAYQSGMARFEKGGDNMYRPARKGAFYKGGDGKMYGMSKADYNRAGEGMDAPGKQPGDQPHIKPHPDDNNDNPGDKEKGGYTAKSTLTVDDFQKSLDELEAIGKAGDPVSRKDELLQKSLNGEELSEDERDYVFKALGGEVAVDDDPKIVDDITKSLTDPEEGLSKALDVSEYLQAQNDALVESLGAVRDSLEKSDGRQHNFNMILAKATHQMGELTKAMSHRLGVLEQQPAHAPKSRGVGQPAQGAALEKGFGGDAPGGEQVSKADILDTMCEMMEKSDPNSDLAKAIQHETAKYEQLNQISKSMVERVMQYRSEQNAH